MGLLPRPAALRVEVDDTTLRVGGVVLGAVILTVHKAIQAEGELSITFEGKERYTWVDSSGDSSSRHTIENGLFLMGERYEIPKTLLPGETSYPFSFQLPHGIPASFKYTTGKRTAESRYTLTAKVARSAMMYKNFTESVFLKIQPTLESLAAPIDSEPVSVSTGKQVHTMGLINHGRCHVRIDLRSDVIPLESPFKFTVFVDNDSGKKIKGLRVVLHQFVVFDPFHKGNECFTTWTYPLIKQDLDKEAAQGIVSGKPILLTLTIPDLANVLPSMSSYYIHSLGYRLAVEVSFGLSSRVKADVPVRVVRKEQVVSVVSTSKLLCLT